MCFKEEKNRKDKKIFSFFQMKSEESFRLKEKSQKL